MSLLSAAPDSLMEEAPVGVYRTRADGRILAANTTLARLLGFEDVAALLQVRTPELHVDPAERAAFLEELRRAAGSPRERRILLRGREGRQVVVRDFARATLDAQGAIAHIDGIMEDVTEQERLREELERSERRYRELVENANDCLYRFDAEGRIVSASGAVERILGYTATEVVGRHVLDVLAPGSHAEVLRRTAAKASGSEERSVYEVEVQRKDGARLWCEVSSRAVRRDGRLEAVEGILRDVSERRRQQERIAEQERRLADLVERVPVGLVRTAPDGTILGSNPALLRILGVDPPLEGRRIQDFYLDPRQREALLANLDLQDVVRYEMPLRRGDGSRAYVRGSARATRDAEGRLLWCEGHVEDVTPEHIAEAALRLLRDLSVEVARASDFPASLGAIVRAVCQAAGWTYGEAWVPDETGASLLPSEAWFAGAPGAGKFRHLSLRLEFALGEDLVGMAARDGRPRWIPELRDEPHFRRGAAAQAAGFRSLAVVPIHAAGRTVAVLCFLHQAPDAEGARWVAALETLASQVGSIVERRRAEDRLRRYARILEAEIESSPDAVLVVGEDGSVLAANRRLRELCGHPAAPGGLLDEAGGGSLQGLVDAVRPLYEAADLGQGVVVAHGRRLHRTHVPLLDEDHLVRGRIWHFRDLGRAGGPHRQP